MGLSETIIEGEALSIIKKMPELCYGKIRNRCIYTKYSPYCGTFRWIHFKHIKNEVNRLAHTIATESLKREE
ncbi:hypothetical protein Gotri_002503 [Gossypium trilobum]|nr:hypothetical protein [Gossypium trilobum]